MSLAKRPSVNEERFHIRWIDAAYYDAPAGALLADYEREEVVEWPSAAKRRSREIVRSGATFMDVVEIEHLRVQGLAYPKTGPNFVPVKLVELTPRDEREWAEKTYAIAGAKSQISCRTTHQNVS